MILSRHAEKLNIYRAIIDILIITISWILAFIIRFNFEIIALTKGPDTLFNYLRLLPLLLLCYFFIFLTSGMYKKSLVKKRIWDENFQLAKNHTISFFIFVTLSFFIYEHRYSRLTLFIFFFLIPIMLPLGRSIIRKWNRFYLKFKNSKKKVIIIGTGPSSEKLAKTIDARSDWNLQLISCHSFSEINIVDKYLKTGAVDLVFIVPSASETIQVNEIYKHLDKNLSDIFLIPYLGEKIFFEPTPIQFEGITALALNSSGLESYGLFLKRLFDIVFSFTFILVFSPVYLICALLVRLSSPGPIFFKQERMGLDGKKFYCIKYRGMYVNAEEKSGPVWAKSNDDRTTPIGKWLRKTSLDEIPQFFNVLKGEMSVVGPRPERPVFVDNFKDQIPGYMLRHKVKAGITGWAQINGWRGNTSLEKRIECDLWYIQNWNIWLDLKIVMLTPAKGLIHPNAY
ncbi:undecaprenyl-phosphate glucose phosphotransferase [Silvanigrella paludirubra]|uniref:Undecaprenyl-phosphate glucose phosphotransferase n=1 Tax=Silvanigrella paludirubra TaxID=2499159 RepID=A0A6N6VXZ1_9BACT|nr:undecaprenyl-phosphate glucose phosphotransferase [Silvanigrella paludirubra]KAB8041024.1 undecaprenyl-phosphate glucose phosphotransferase [Silvanigrella paludirubra]